MHTFHLDIDAAKAKLDCALRTPQGKHRHKVFDNNIKGFESLSAWLHKQDQVSHLC